jgi:predicted AlkP superfamily phosphohydrolase/phosphomutase
VLTENGRESKFEFNKDLWNKESLKLFKRKEGEKKMIEQIDSTFFVSIYFNGKRNVSIPIKEVTPEFLKLYAVPTGSMEMIAYRKE